GLAGLEGGDEPVGLLLEVLASLLEQVARLDLGVAGGAARLVQHLTAVLGEEIPRLAPALRRQQQRRRRARDRSEKEPAEIARVRIPLVRHDPSSSCSFSGIGSSGTVTTRAVS